MYAGAATGLRGGLVLLAILAAPAVQGQATAARWAHAHADAQERHLSLVGAWGAANAVAGTTVLLLADDTGARAFGLQSALWGVVNLSIAGIGLAGSSDIEPTTVAAVRGREARTGRLLRLNLGLNAGYVAAGVAMVALAPADGAEGARWRGHGAAVAVQGLALLALDGVAYASCRRRQRALAETVTLVPTAAGLAVVVSL